MIERGQEHQKKIKQEEEYNQHAGASWGTDNAQRETSIERHIKVEDSEDSQHESGDGEWREEDVTPTNPRQQIPLDLARFGGPYRLQEQHEVLRDSEVLQDRQIPRGLSLSREAPKFSIARAKGNIRLDFVFAVDGGPVIGADNLT